MSLILSLLLLLSPCSAQVNFLQFFWSVYIINIARIVYAFDLLFKYGHRLLTGLTYKDLYWYLKLSVLKPIHAKTVSKVYGHLKRDKGKQFILNGFRAAGIMEAVKKIRENPKSRLNQLFSWFSCVEKKCGSTRNKTIVVL